LYENNNNKNNNSNVSGYIKDKKYIHPFIIKMYDSFYKGIGDSVLSNENTNCKFPSKTNIFEVGNEQLNNLYNKDPLFYDDINCKNNLFSNIVNNKFITVK